MVWPAVELRHLPAEETPRFLERKENKRGKAGSVKLINKEWILTRCKLNESTGCWDWGWAIGEDGYAKSNIRGNHPPMHRVAFMLWRGPIPEGLWVLHKCDNPKCCNPNHLFLGDAKTNIIDCITKGRMSHATHVTTKRRTKTQVIEIRNDPRSTRALSKVLGLGESIIRKIRLRQTYAWVQ